MKIVWTSDLHLGLKTGNIDRTDEIIDVLFDIVDHTIELMKNHEVILVLGGDIFNSSNPSENLISRFIAVINELKKHNIETYVMVGNHDAISDPNRLSCLKFIKRIKIGYPNLNLIEDIEYIEMGDFGSGPVAFTFLPHISKALIAKKVKEGKLKEEIPVQEYIDMRADKILEKIGQGTNHIAFSHLNVRNVHGGSEENLLRKSESYLPNSFINTPLGYIKPTIIQGHIHSHQQIDNVHIVGSPIFCTFGEAETKKYFLEYTLSESFGTEDKMDYLRTECLSFKQLEVDMITDNTDFFDREDVKQFIADIDNYTIAKIDVLISPDNNTYNWTDIRTHIFNNTNAVDVREIIPRIVPKRIVKSRNQKASLNPDSAIKVYLKRNLIKDTPKLKRVYSLSRKYTQEAVNAN